MQISESTHDGVVVIHLSGDVLGGPEAQAINDHLRREVQAGNRKPVPGGSGVGLVNSSGLGLLIAGLTVVRNAGGDLRLAAPSSKLLKLLEVTKLSQVFSIYPDVQQAVQSFQTV